MSKFMSDTELLYECWDKQKATEARLAEAERLLKGAMPHLYAVDRKGWCWCADDKPDRDPGDHDPDCKWIAYVERVAGLRVDIDAFLAASDAPKAQP